MTLQQLKYMITVAEKGSITEAAKELFISQPSLSGAIKEVENEAGITIFNRCRAGVALTTEGMEFLGYARQVVQQMELLESRYIDNQLEKQRFCISTQHYTFAANAFVELVQQFGQERYEFILNETQTYQIIMDVRNRFSDLGVLYLSKSNDGYTISSGIFPRYLHGDSIISVPLEGDETMRIGYILNKDRELSRLGEIYVEALKQYQKD